MGKELSPCPSAQRPAEDCLARLGIHLPDAPTPFGAYVPAVQTGNLLFLSGVLATSGHTATAVGVVGGDLNGKAGREAAHTAALNALGLNRMQLGSLNRVNRVVRLGVMSPRRLSLRSTRRSPMRHRSCFEMSLATKPSLRASSLVSRVFHSVRRSSWKSTLK
jgi:hypothetical protein